jgi:hypothetical protein
MAQQLHLLVFDGKTFDFLKDSPRLTSLLHKVLDYLKDGQYHSLHDIQVHCGGTECSVSARLRDLRKIKFGSHHIEAKREEGGLWTYRLNSNSGSFSSFPR